MEVFGEEKIEFNNLINRLKEHLFEVDPIELNFEILPKKFQNAVQCFYYDLPVYIYSDSQREQIEFLLKANYEFFN